MSINKTIIPRKMRDFIVGKLTGRVGADSISIYDSQDPYYNGIGRFIRNTICWLNRVDNISCFSPAQLSGSNWRHRAGTLITTKHVLFARHYTPAIISGGTPLIFVDKDSNVIRRKLMQIATPAVSADIAVGRLDFDIPENIKPAKVLPKNYADYIDLYAINPLYMVGVDQQEKALLKRFLDSFSGYIGAPIRALDFPINLVDYPGFNEDIIAGDSGNPFFFVINNELVLAATWFFGYGRPGGPFVSDAANYDEINRLISNLSPGEGYALLDVDLNAAYNNMPKVYFQPFVDDNWTTPGNWFQDDQFFIPAPSPPVPTDIPVLPWDKSAQRVIGGTGVLSGF